jgi:glycosyltransferase involved in cell wall biosynthesis
VKLLRIAILAPTFLPKCSGAEVFHHNLATRLVEAGHGVTVIAPRARVRQLRAEDWDLPYAVVAYPDRRWSWLRRHRRFGFWLNRRALDALQRKHRFDVWHAFVLYPAGVVLADWQRHAGVPGLVRAVGDDVAGLPTHRHAAHVAESLREKLPAAGAVVALSRGMSDALSALGVPSEKIRILPNAVDAARFSGSPETRRAVRAAMGLPDNAFVFLCVARHHPQKDFPTLLSAFRELRRRHPSRDLHLVIAGRDAEGLRPRIGDLAGSVHLCQFGAENPARGVPTLPPDKLVGLYLAADAFVLSSLLEGFSSALVEAMAAGLPVVVTEAPGIRGVVEHEREALLVPVGDPGALTDGLQRLIGDAGLRARLSAAARATAGSYSWPVLLAGYTALYRELIAGSLSRRHG